MTSYHHQSNRQVEVCTKFEKWTIKTSRQTNNNVSVALLQIGLTPVGAGLPSTATNAVQQAY